MTKRVGRKGTGSPVTVLTVARTPSGSSGPVVPSAVRRAETTQFRSATKSAANAPAASVTAVATSTPSTATATSRPSAAGSTAPLTVTVPP